MEAARCALHRLDNYLAIAQDPVAWSSLGRTLLWIGLTVPLQLALGLAAALLLNQRFAWCGLARSLILIPWALPSVVIALMWSWMYRPQVGLFKTCCCAWAWRARRCRG